MASTTRRSSAAETQVTRAANHIPSSGQRWNAVRIPSPSPWLESGADCTPTARGKRAAGRKAKPRVRALSPPLLQPLLEFRSDRPQMKLVRAELRAVDGNRLVGFP